MFSAEAIKAIREGALKGEPVRGPVDVQIMPLNFCNQACVFCPLQAVPEKAKRKYAPRFLDSGQTMEWSTFERIVNGLEELGEVERVHFTGGEPLMHPRIADMVKAFKKRFSRVSVGVVTNGALLNERFEEILKAGIDRISVSINAADEKAHMALSPSNHARDFRLILEGIKKAGDYKRALIEKGEKGSFELALTCVLTRHNYNSVAGLAEIAENVGAQSVTFIPLVPFEYEGVSSTAAFAVSKKQFAKFIKDIKEIVPPASGKGIWLGYSGEESDQGILKNPEPGRPCYAGYAFCVFWPDGAVRPCCNCEAQMGNIIKQSLREIWFSEAYRDFRAKSIRGDLPASMGCSCMECGYLYENRIFSNSISRLRG